MSNTQETEASNMPMANNHSCPPQSAILSLHGYFVLTTRDSWVTPSWHFVRSPGSHASLTTTPLRVPPGTTPPISPQRGFRPVPLLPKDIILSSVS